MPLRLLKESRFDTDSFYHNMSPETPDGYNYYFTIPEDDDDLQLYELDIIDTIYKTINTTENIATGVINYNKAKYLLADVDSNSPLYQMLKGYMYITDNELYRLCQTLEFAHDSIIFFPDIDKHDYRAIEIFKLLYTHTNNYNSLFAFNNAQMNTYIKRNINADVYIICDNVQAYLKSHDHLMTNTSYDNMSIHAYVIDIKHLFNYIFH